MHIYVPCAFWKQHSLNKLKSMKNSILFQWNYFIFSQLLELKEVVIYYVLFYVLFMCGNCFCSVLVYVSLHFLPILFQNQVFIFLCFLHFFRPANCFEFDNIRKWNKHNTQVLFLILFSLYKNYLLKYKNRIIKIVFPERFWEKIYL